MEKDTQKQCTDYLRYTGWFVIENWRNTGYVAGISDITAIKKGRVVWIEFKRKKEKYVKAGKQSKGQIDFMNNLKTHGGEYIVIRELDELTDYLKIDMQCTLL